MNTIRLRVKIPFCKDPKCGWISGDRWFPFEKYGNKCLKCEHEVGVMSGVLEIPADWEKTLIHMRPDIASCIIR